MGGRTTQASELGRRKFNFQTALIVKHFRVWEKKYGKGAKRIIKPREEETKRKKMKEEKRRQRETAARRPHWVMKKASESPKMTDSGYGGQVAPRSGGVVKVGERMGNLR